MIESPRQAEQLLEKSNYIADKQTALAFYLGYALKKPLLVEGPPGVGKTELAKTAANIFNTELIRLQCYEGLDASQALYEWNYAKQLIRVKLAETDQLTPNQVEKELFGEDYLIRRPLLRSIMADKMPVLLIDELDRSDEEFESFLLEILSDWQVTIPEYGTIKANHVPLTIVTANRTRELSEALRRRCLYLWVDYPSIEKEKQVLLAKVPGISQELAQKICELIAAIRETRIMKKPGTAEALDWAKTLAVLHYDSLDAEIIQNTLGIILKDQGDIKQASMSLADLLDKLGIGTRMAPSREG